MIQLSLCRQVECRCLSSRAVRIIRRSEYVFLIDFRFQFRLGQNPKRLKLFLGESHVVSECFLDFFLKLFDSLRSCEFGLSCIISYSHSRLKYRSLVSFGHRHELLRRLVTHPLRRLLGMRLAIGFFGSIVGIGGFCL